MAAPVRLPATVREQARELKDERDFPSLGEAVRFMCREGEWDV